MDAATDIIGNLMPIWGWLLYGIFSAGVMLCFKKTVPYKPTLKSLFIIYTVFVLLLTLITRTRSADFTAKWIPFWSWYEVIVNHRQRLLEEIILNILMLMPLGIITALLSSRAEVKHAFCIGLILSCTIEFLQLILRLGLFEWDDIIHNTLGCVVGFVIMRKLKKAFLLQLR